MPNNERIFSKTFIWGWLTVLILLAIYVRVHGAGVYYYSEDEILHIWLAKAKSLKQLMVLSLYETHPPLGHLLRYYWLQIDDSVWFSRCLSLVFGIATIPVYYCIGNRLKGQFAGMCAAALAAYSYGSIIESYVTRNYSIFVFFATMFLYYYVQWRDSRQNKHLWLYVFYALLAALTHFSAILAIFPIAAYETVDAYVTKRPLRSQLQWIALNFTLAAIAIGIYLIWFFKGIVLSSPYFHVDEWYKYILITLINPLTATLYVLPSAYFLPLIIFLLFLPVVREDKKFRDFSAICVIALEVGMFLIAINHYYPAGTRHGIWVMPFIIVTAGWMMGNGAELLSPYIEQKTRINGNIAVATLILLGSLILCNAGQRFEKEPSEYQMKQENWQAMTDYLKTLDNHSVIIAARDDAVMLHDTYPYLGKDAFTDKNAAVIIPYANTHIIIHPYERRIETTGILLATLNQAQQKGMLNGVDKLVFMKTVWDVYAKGYEPLPWLFTCKQLDKQIVSFPSFNFPEITLKKSVSDEEKALAPAAFMTVSKKEFFEQVIAPNGKAHECLK